MKKALLALAAIAVLGGSSLALVGTTGANPGPQAAECGPCDPGSCTPCPGCPCK
jgi:hypothetical protein